MISEISKRDIMDVLVDGFLTGKFYYNSRIDEITFLNRIVNLDELPFSDSRYLNMAEDIRQHTINNKDWELYWAFTDERLNLFRDDEIFVNFIEQIFHPNVIEDQSNWKDYLSKINTVLAHDNMQLIPEEKVSGRQTYKLISINDSKVITEYSEQIKINSCNTTKYG